jgi:ribosomal protein S3
MGQKVHPESMRVGYIHDWKSNWFTERNFDDYLDEDVRIRDHILNSSRTPACRTSRSARTPTRWRSTSTPRARAS